MKDESLTMWLQNLKNPESLIIPTENLIKGVLNDEKPILEGFPKETQWVVLRNKCLFKKRILLVVTLLGDCGVSFNDKYLNCAVHVDAFSIWVMRNEKNKSRVIDGLQAANLVIATQLSQEEEKNGLSQTE